MMPGAARHGEARRGKARQGKDFQITKIGGNAGRCLARPGPAGQGKVFFLLTPMRIIMKTFKASELILDFDLYPRNNVDSHNVRNLYDALSSGAELPAVIIEKKTKRVVDGFHRVRAVIQHGGPNAEINVIEKTYKDDGELFLDAMRYNSAHGAKLDSCDRSHCAIIAERLSLPLDVVAGALHMPPGKLGELIQSRTAKSAGGLSLPLKRTFSHFAGRKLNKQQEEANRRSSGMQQAFYANQLIEMIETKLLDTTDEKLLDRLRVLAELLDDVLAAK